jgi:FdhD protein
VRKGSTFRRNVEQVAVQGSEVQRTVRRDSLATEEPLEIRIVPAPPGTGRPMDPHPVAVTMRTPGADFELAAGFLFSEGLIEGADRIAAIRYCVDTSAGDIQQYNIVNVFLAAGAPFDPASLQRNFYATSSCGVCGKASIEAVRVLGCSRVADDLRIRAETLLGLPGKLHQAQPVFERTGGLHAAGLFSADGELLRLREDVGRHNALDKLIGSAALAGELPLARRLVLVSGRLSFELVQKAARAGASLLAGISAPSSLAVELAQETGLTLVGFLREHRFNIYAGAERISG